MLSQHAIEISYTHEVLYIRDCGSNLYIGIDMAIKLLPIDMVWEVIGKERVKASIT